MSYPPKVLIVEDEAIFSLDMRMLLKSDGIAAVAVVDNAADAFREIEKEKPDIVLMDIHLKGNMDGVDAASIIRSRYDLPTIYVTAHADRALLERARMTEPSGYLVKPVERETLRATIFVALHNNQMRLARIAPGV